MHGPSGPRPPAPTRQQRRRQRQDDAKRLAKLARSAPAPSPAALAEQAEVFHAVLAKDADLVRASRAADAAHRGFDQSLARHFRDPGIACRKGCAFCCHAYVAVSAPEALLAAQRLRSLPEPERTLAAARVREIDHRTRELAPRDRAGRWIPCPMLEDGRCRIYDVRPFSCRAEMSMDAGACESLAAGKDARVRSPALAPALKIMYSTALAVAARRAGLSGGVYEFNAALRIALDGDDTEARWLAGEDVFAAAVIHPEARDAIDRALRPRSAPDA